MLHHLSGILTFNLVVYTKITRYIRYNSLMWLFFFPSAITCIALSSIENGIIRYSPDISAPFDFGTAAVYICNTGFFLEGNMMRSCGGSEASIVGNWDGTDPTCSGMEPKLFSWH